MKDVVSATAVTALVVKPVSYTEFAEAILGSGWETYDWWYDWETIPSERDYSYTTLVIKHEDKNEPDSLVVSTFTMRDLLEAYNNTVKAYSANGIHLSLEDMDCAESDCVLQRLVYGEVVFG